jgi:lysophospholipase L1-like esterase
MRKVLLSFLLALIAVQADAQKKIVVMGSSTAAGAAATSFNLSWAGRLQAFYRQLTSGSDPDTTVTVVAGYGYTSYRELPTGYVAPIPREPVDPNNNITKALSYSPDIVIVNLPGNDVASFAQSWVTPPYSIQETMENFRVMRQAVLATGAKFFITTTQPRNDLNAAQRQMQRDLKDAIIATFGIYSINFWDDLVTTDGSLGLRDEVRHLGFADADYHLNDLGHQLVFERVKQKDIFNIADAPLAVVLSGFHVDLHGDAAVIGWNTAQEEPNSFFEIQRSGDGQRFEMRSRIAAMAPGQGAHYAWTDQDLLPGKNNYRLRIVESNRISYSNVLSVSNKIKAFAISRLYVHSSELHIEISSQKTDEAVFVIVNMEGVAVERLTRRLDRSTTSMDLDLSRLPGGDYFLKVSIPEGNKEVRRFAWFR